MQIFIRQRDLQPDVFGRRTIACAIEGCRWTGIVKARPGKQGEIDATREQRRILGEHLERDHAEELRNRGRGRRVY